MEKRIKEVKEQLANELNYKSWEDCINDQPNYKVEALMDTVAIRLCRSCKTFKEAQYRPSPDIDKWMIEHGYKICD